MPCIHFNKSCICTTISCTYKQLFHVSVPLYHVYIPLYHKFIQLHYISISVYHVSVPLYDIYIYMQLLIYLYHYIIYIYIYTANSCFHVTVLQPWKRSMVRMSSRSKLNVSLEETVNKETTKVSDMMVLDMVRLGGRGPCLMLVLCWFPAPRTLAPRIRLASFHL